MSDRYPNHPTAFASRGLKRSWAVAPHALSIRALCALVTLFASACSTDSGTVTIRGADADLDVSSRRADSLIEASAARAVVDTARLTATIDAAIKAGDTSDIAVLRAQRTPTRSTSGVDLSLPGDNAMSRRAQARGDSMAKAYAEKFAAGANGVAGAGGDTVRGIVTVTGELPARRTVLKAAGGAMISMSGMVTSGMARLVGAEIVARGVLVTPRDVVVNSYSVRTVDGVPAWDGQLEESGGVLMLQLSDGSGRKRVTGGSATLRELVGSRVWVTMKDGETVHAFGIVGRR